MEHIILDTNIFLKENFLEGKRIRQLLKLSEEEKIKIVLTEITIGEVKSNFKKFSRQALTNLAIFRKPFESRVLRNNSIGKHLYDRIDKKVVESEFNDEFDALLTKSKVLVIDYSEINIKTVFDSYFKNEYPFNGGDKKNEFPDAFALVLIEKWCAENEIKCTIFSSDKDFLNFKSEHLHITKDYEIYLDEKLQYYLTQEHRISILQELFEKNSQKIDKETEEWYRYKLDDDSLYYSVVWFEIQDLEVTDILIKNKSYQIVSIEEESIEIEVEVKLTFKVEVVIDDEDYSYYDSDDKQRHYFQTKREEIERDATATLSILAHITDKDDYDEEFEILEINKDAEIVIESDEEDYR
jgi:hypothetical protein